METANCLPTIISLPPLLKSPDFIPCSLGPVERMYLLAFQKNVSSGLWSGRPLRYQPEPLSRDLQGSLRGATPKEK